MLYILAVLLFLQAQMSIGHADVTYLSPKIGSGTDADPYRPHRTPGVWDDCMELATHFLCIGGAVPGHVSVIPISTTASSRITASEKAALQSVTGKSVTADTFEALMTDIIDTKGIVLEPDKDNLQHIKLRGKEIWSRPAPLKAFLPGIARKLDAALHLPIDMISVSVAWATTLATETFTASDGDLAGCEARGCTHTWTEPLSGTDWTIVSNQANTATTTGGLGRADSALATGDHEAQVTLVSFSASGGSLARCGVAFRKDSGATDTFYRFFADFAAGTPVGYEMQRRAAGVTTSLATGGSGPANSDIIKGRVSGSSLSGYVNGALVTGPTTDGSPITSANTYTGIWANAGGSSTFSCTLDTFSAADFTPVRQGPVIYP